MHSDLFYYGYNAMCEVAIYKSLMNRIHLSLKREIAETCFKMKSEEESIKIKREDEWDLFGAVGTSVKVILVHDKS